MQTEFIPDGFQVVELDADGNELTEESLENLENFWTDTVGQNPDEVLLERDMELVRYFDEESRLVIATKKVFYFLQVEEHEEPSQHDWIGSQTFRKNPGSGVMDTTAESAPWRDMRDVQTYRFEFREPIAEPADRAGQGFLGNVAERLESIAGIACNTCNIVRAQNGACFC